MWSSFLAFEPKAAFPCPSCSAWIEPFDMSYDPGPTAAVASFVLSFMMRSSLLLNAASPPSVRSITALGS